MLSISGMANLMLTFRGSGICTGRNGRKESGEMNHNLLKMFKFLFLQTNIYLILSYSLFKLFLLPL